MSAPVWTLLLMVSTASAVPASPSPDEARLARAVAEITLADFRGQRLLLRDSAARLAAVQDGALARYRHYWRGFALWRSAINGSSESPMPDDVRSDLEAAILAFRAAERIAPDWVEPKIGLAICWTGLAFVPGGLNGAVSREEFVAVRDLLRDATQDNPARCGSSAAPSSSRRPKRAETRSRQRRPTSEASARPVPRPCTIPQLRSGSRGGVPPETS